MSVLLPSGGDDTVAIQAALDSGEAVLGSGQFNVSATLNIGDGNGGSTPSTKRAVKFKGRGGGFAAYPDTVLYYTGPTTTAPLVNVKGQIGDVAIEDMFLALNGKTSGIAAKSFSGSKFEGLKIMNPSNGGIGFGAFGGTAPTGNYNIFNEWRRIHIALLTPSSIGLYMDGDYSVQNDTWISAFDLLRIETVAGATGAVCAWFKFVDSITFRRCHFDPTPEPTSHSIIFDALNNHNFPAGMAFYDCSVSKQPIVYENATHKIRKNYFYGYGTYDNEPVPTHPRLCGITDQGMKFGQFLM